MNCCTFTNQALGQIIPQIHVNGHDPRLTDLTLIDLQKAFDTLDYKILLDKMNCLGFSDKRI